MKSDIYETYLIETRNEQSLLKADLKKKKISLFKIRTCRQHYLESQKIITEIFVECSQEAKQVIEVIINLALKTIFADKYSFELKYEVKRNQVESQPILYKYGMPRVLKDEVGEGVVDIISFGFRLAVWALQESVKKCHFFVLDEPFKSVAEENEPLAAQMLQETFSALQIQCLLTTHSGNIKDYLDKVYLVEAEEKISTVIKLDE